MAEKSEGNGNYCYQIFLTFPLNSHLVIYNYSGARYCELAGFLSTIWGAVSFYGYLAWHHYRWTSSNGGVLVYYHRSITFSNKWGVKSSPQLPVLKQVWLCISQWTPPSSSRLFGKWAAYRFNFFRTKCPVWHWRVHCIRTRCA